MLTALITAAAAATTTTGADTTTCADRSAARSLFLGWLDASSIPGAYTTPAERISTSSHPGDLTHTRIFFDGPLGATTTPSRAWPHTKPNPVYSRNATARAQFVDAVAFLLRRGMSRLQDTVLSFLETVSAAQVEQLLAHARRALDSFEDFWASVRWTVAYGPRQTEWHVDEEQKEYGPETNFWSKFRPTLTCHHAPRLGPELGGAKAWCNPHAWPSPKAILSAGAGDDMMYETIAAAMWPGVTIVTPDCYQFHEAARVAPPEWNGSQVLLLPLCLTGEDDAYVALAPPRLREKFVTYPAMLAALRERHGVDGFDFVKCNIEASEYPLFAHVFRDVDANLAGTAQINIEMHRMGMHDGDGDTPGGGRDFNSLLFMQLLWATFLSGGFHPVFVEKWHDRNAAEDVVWVNQTWWLGGELDAVASIWTRRWPDVPPTPATYPDAAALARQHAAGADPYRAPQAARTVAKQQQAAAAGASSEAAADAADASTTTATGVVSLDAAALRALRASAAAPALLKVDPPACAQCAELDQIWAMIAENVDKVVGRGGVAVYALSCEAQPAVCADLLGEEVPPGAMPAFGVWADGRIEPYGGARNPEALIGWLGETVRAADASAAAMARAEAELRDAFVAAGVGAEPPPRGAWAQLPVEVVEELSVADFLRQYVEPQRPVILRRRSGAAAAPRVDVEWLRRECAAGKIFVFERDVASVGWGGFGEPQPSTLGAYLERLAGGGTEHYAFDLKAACDCGALLDRVPLLDYFSADEVPFDAQLPPTNWPSLIVGPGGSRSALHVDSAFLPFWLTLLGGRKTFRVVTRDEWRARLARPSAAGAPLYSSEGKALSPVDAFDDGFAERELLGRGATVWNGTLDVGDSIYLPTGALHGALNAADAGAAIALTSNFLDGAHAAQVDADYCAALAAHERAANAICARLMRPPKYGERADAGGAAVRARSFWDWLLGRREWCAKYRAAGCAAARERCGVEA